MILIDCSGNAGRSMRAVIGGISADGIGVFSLAGLVSGSTEAVVPFIVATVTTGRTGETIVAAKVAIGAEVQTGECWLIVLSVATKRNTQPNVQAVIFIAPFVITALQRDIPRDGAESVAVAQRILRRFV